MLHSRCPPRLGARPIEILLEVLLTGFFDVLLELPSRAFRREHRGQLHPVLAGLGLLVLGGVAAALVTLLYPTRLFGTPAIPGASLVVSPLLNGALMHYYGLWQRRRWGHASFAATFWGGATFAFGFALVRFLMLGGS